MRQTPDLTNGQNLKIDFDNRFNYMSLGLLAFTGVLAFGVQFKMTMTRKDTFARNFALVEDKYLAKHKEAFGPDAKLSEFGYPDMGNNIYSECLSYKDWITLNNAQRCHENF